MLLQNGFFLTKFISKKNMNFNSDSSKRSCSLEVSFSSHTLSRVNNNNHVCMIRITSYLSSFKLIKMKKVQISR